MDTGLPTPPKPLTNNEQNVITWAFNLVHSIVAGDYHLPKSMCYAMNNLQDAVWELAKDRHVSIEDGCSKEYLAFHDGYWKGVEEQIKGGKA